MMPRTPVKSDTMEKEETRPSVSDTEQESEPNSSSRRLKRRALRSPELINSFKLDSTLNAFKYDISEHITKLFTTFQRSQDAKFTTLMTDINVIKQEVMEIRTSNEETDKKIDDLSSHYENVQAKTTKLGNDLESSKIKIKSLENKLEDLSRQTCAYKLEIRNIPSKERETTGDLSQIIEKLLDTLKIEVQPAEIRNIRRLPGKPDAPRPIVMELATTNIKNKIVQEARNFNKKNSAAKLNTTHLSIMGTPRPIFIGENLTFRAKGLYYKAREYAKANDFAYCWTSEGQVYLRKKEGSNRIFIKDEEQLQDIEQSA